MNIPIPANKLMSGTFGKVQVSGAEIAEISSFQAKVAANKEEVQMAGCMATDSKVTNTKGTGSMTIKKVYSRFYDYMESIQKGVDVRVCIIGTLNDPDAYGAERVACYNCSLDEHTFADWAVGKHTEITVNFTFTHAEYLDKVG